MKPVTSAESSKRLPSREMRRVFHRLFEDVGAAMNQAVAIRRDEGQSLADIARKMDCDRAFLTRLLSGESGTNLRSIARLLYGTDTRLRIDLVRCEELRSVKATRMIADMCIGKATFANDAPTNDPTGKKGSAVGKSTIHYSTAD